MAQITPELAKQRANIVRRIDLDGGDHVFFVPPTAGTMLALDNFKETNEGNLWLLSQVLSDADGNKLFDNGAGVDELKSWPAEMVTELLNADFLELASVTEAKKN